MSTLLQPYNEKMMEVLLYIQRNLDADLSPETLAGVACFSVTHFHRIFKGMVGESLKEHVRRLRLEKAAYKLSYTDASVMEIALDARFESAETFSRAFKKRFSVPPSEFRSRSREILNLQGTGKIHYRPKPSRNDFRLDDSPLSCEVQVRRRNETKVAFIRHIGSYFEVESAWSRLCTWGGSKNLLTAETEFIGICYDDPDVTPSGKIRYDACLSIIEETETTPEIRIQTIPGGSYAVTTHLGPYEKLVDTYRELYGKWLPAYGYSLNDSIASFEKYIKTPAEVGPEDLVTEIWMGLC
ncbi:AraC family transcriptional regulator [Maridesulfovibrio sp.]|uniref:AraC family transcriptional regulator n=1 Tax=Maridesulfovibrio sp. TaxID=2795000 RepID=UPI002A18CF84|nr:AraC family transcriptional regulator [Maridesulfovibrio sp.]